MVFEPKSLVKDLSGRGFAVTLSLLDLQGKWDLDFKNDPANELEPTLGEWLELAEIGDIFSNQKDQVRFTRIE